MIFPDLFNGPRFENGDLVNFTFEDCELTYRVPEVPESYDNLDSISQQHDFRIIDTSSWSESGGFYSLNLSRQSWIFEQQIFHQDIMNRIDIMGCSCSVGLVKLRELEINSELALELTQLKCFLLTQLKQDFTQTRFPNRIDWPSIENDFFIEKTPTVEFMGFSVELDTSGSGLQPSVNAYIPLNKSLLLTTELDINPLITEGIQYPYTPEFLRQFKKDLFKDFLSHIKIEYSGETLKKIQQNNKTTSRK
jgi:hypothetical protein